MNALVGASQLESAAEVSAHGRVRHNAFDCVALHVSRNLLRRDLVKNGRGVIQIAIFFTGFSSSRV
jgi:hypothetical protein